MNSHKISVIIPTHNNGNELRRAVQSILAQNALALNLCTIEIILINDASDRKYLPLQQQLTIDFPVCRLIHTEKQSGPAAARNLGIQVAEGDLVGFLDADDEWPSDKVSTLVPFFQSDSVDVAGGKIQYVIEDGAGDLNMKFEDEQNRITHVHLGALLVRKSVFQPDLLFDESLTFSEDVDWWLRIREKNIGIVLSEATTLLYYVHGNNMSVNKSMEELQLLKIFHKSVKRRKNNLISPYMPQIKDFRVDQDDPLISIILPLYNGRHLVGKTLDSVVSQTYANWELIVVDDGSIDNGAAFVAENYPQATIIRQKNAGVAAARNKGIQHSSGDVLAFLDQDDEWLPDKLRIQWELLKSDPYCAFVTCNQRFVCQDGVVLPPNFSEKLLEEHRGLVPSALLIRKPVIRQVDMFDESLEVSSDFDLIRRLRKANYKENNADQLLLIKWFHGENASQNKKVLRNEILELLYRQSKGR